MQSGGYGSGVSEMQQFMVDGGGCPSSLFSISASPPAAAEIQKYHHPLGPPHPHHLQQPQSPHFVQYCHPIPITQQLFQQPHHHHHQHPFQLFHHHQQQQHHLGLEQDRTRQESSSSPGGPQSFLAAMTFKLGVNESSGGGGDGGGGSRNGLNEDEGILHGDDGSESRLHLHHHHHQRWHGDEESAAAGNIKEPFWRPLDIDFANPNNKRPADDIQPGAAEMSSANLKHFKKSSHECHDHLSNQAKTAENAAATDSNYKLFSELEAICKPGGTPSGCGGGGGSGGVNNANQTGSGSALTGDDNPFMLDADPGPAIQPDNVSDTSNGGDAPLPLPTSKSSSGGQKQRGKKKKKKKHQQLSWIATFFESLVKQLVDHQESLHRKFLEAMEKRDQERTNREEAWRKREAARGSREAATRAQKRALAASRESAIIAFLEKITGESLVLPPKAQFQAQFTEESQKKHDDVEAQNAVEPYNADSANNVRMGVSSSRWPKAEVQALIRVRSGFETRFHEQGLKGPLWEEVSKEMAAMGYSRSSKRCKEKWENINKYFRKTKGSGKKRPQHSKTCPYFHQLDQLYSTAKCRSMQMLSSTSNVHGEAEQRKDNSELLDAIVVVSNEPGKNEGDEDEEVGNEEGQGESQGDHDLRKLLHLCNGGGGGGGFDRVRS